MNITFQPERLEKCFNTMKAAIRIWGERTAKIALRRMDDLSAAGTLEDMRYIPGDCHEYRERKDHLLTMDLDGGKRLLFQPDHDPVPVLADGKSLNWSNVTRITILGVKDPHGKGKKRI